MSASESRPTHAVPINSGDRVCQALVELSTEQELLLRVRGHCMQPVLCDGEHYNWRVARRYWPGDILVFRARQGYLVAHRLLGCYRREGEWRYLTRADDTRRPDAAIPGDRVLGRVCSKSTSAVPPDQQLGVPLRTRLACARDFVRLGLGRLLSRNKAR